MTDSTISADQRGVLAKLAPVLSKDVYLAGGVAIAAHLHHRESRDLDLFSASDPLAELAALERVAGLRVASRAVGTLHLVVDGVPVSLLRYEYAQLAPPDRLPELEIAVASIDDLTCMKLAAIASRGLARDFWDLHALMLASGRDLAAALVLFQRKYPVHDIGHVVRSLSYFGDAEAQPLPRGLSPASWAAIRKDFETWCVAFVARQP
jgi:hypothetical protein